MKLPQLKKPKWNYLALSFAFPAGAMLILMLIAGYTPFGNKSMLYSDMWHQYYPFFKAFRKALLSGDSLLYNWNIGMGIDYLGLISYYLASPLNLLSVLVPEQFLLQYFALLMPIKLGLAGLFFAIFLKKVFKKNDISLPLFGCFYAMCAWALGYQWNVMWLDTFALLPLVALGTVQLLRERKFILYTLALFLSVFSNYYIGFFTCIFILLIFICYQICRCRSVKRFFADLGLMALFSVLAIGMAAILELPALAALQTTQSSVNSYPKDFALNVVDSDLCKEAKAAWKAYQAAKEAGEGGLFSLWWTALRESIPPILEGMRQVAGNMNGGLEPTFKEGLPNLYCGVGTIILAFLFLTTGQVKLRDKLCCVLLLVFFMVSFLVRQLDYIWHGFHFTNMIPYRFSFLFSFVMLYMAYRAYLMRRHFQLWQFITAGLLSICIMLCSDSRSDPVYIAYNAVFFLLYMVIFVYAWQTRRPPKTEDRAKLREFWSDRAARRRYANIGLSVVMGLELILNVVNFGVRFPYTGISNYPNGTKYTASMIRYMQEDDDLFYRAEVTHSQTLNDGALNGYNGISTFTSSANVSVTQFMKYLGYAAKNTYNRYCYEEASPVSNLFLNLKYMIERDGNVEENPYFTEKHHYGNVYLLENNAYLPLGFLAESALADFAFESSSNHFIFQNQLFQSATGLTEDVWSVTPSSWLTIEANGTNITNQSAAGYCAYSNDSAQTTLVYSYTVGDSGFLCLDLTMSARNKFEVWRNGAELYSESLSLPQTLSVSQVEPGDIIEIMITCKANESGSITIRAGLLNDSVFRQGYDILAASTLELTEFSNTRVEGTIDCNRDGLLYTSVPQNGDNWSVTVDGEPAQIKPVGDAMIAVALTEGRHTVTFTYRNDAFNLGWKISLVCFLLFAAITVTVYYPKLKKYKGKYMK